MPSTFTTSGIELIADGEQTGLWGQTTNLNLQIIDRLTSQAGTITLSGTTHTLTVSAGALSDGQYGVLVFAGSPSGTNTVTISPNTAQRVFIVRNTTAQSVVLTQGSGGNVTIATNKGAIVYANGAGAGAAVVDVTATFNFGTVTSVSGTGTVNGISLSGTVTSSGNLTLGGTLSGVNLTSQVTGTLPAGNGGTGNAFFSVSGPATSVKTYTFPNESMSVGFRTIPQNSQSAAYTLVLEDSGKHILHPSADTTARTFTIPANSSVAFPVGTAITFINQNGAGVVTIAITTDTMRLAGGGATGSRTLAANGVATAIKVTSTEWIISGVGLT
jgi:hypothetical protein